MRLTAPLFVLMALALPATAQEDTAACEALYDGIAAETPVNLDQCRSAEISYTLDTCTPPPEGPAGLRPSSHLILAIDASGSMAGPAGSQTKMAVAKDAALSFLRDSDPDIAVGLMVYGHLGDNSDAGKSISCAGAEMIHPFTAPRTDLADSIAALRATGWTPIGGALQAAGTVVAALPPRDGDAATTPVVYLISDGEETCGGDPVAAATALRDAGIPTIVHTIGFDVDPVAEAQLQTIAQAGDGIYYPARGANGLRDQLKRIRDAEAAMARYKYCALLNAGRIGVAYHNEIVKLSGCYARNNPQKRTSAVFNAINRFKRDDAPEAACEKYLMDRALSEAATQNTWLAERTGPLNDQARFEIDQYYISSGLKSLVAPE